MHQARTCYAPLLQQKFDRLQPRLRDLEQLEIAPIRERLRARNVENRELTPRKCTGTACGGRRSGCALDPKSRAVRAWAEEILERPLISSGRIIGANSATRANAGSGTLRSTLRWGLCRFPSAHQRGRSQSDLMTPRITGQDTRRLLDAVARLHTCQETSESPAVMRAAVSSLVRGEIVAA